MKDRNATLKNFSGNRIFLSAKSLAEAAAEYFEWCDTHPLLEEVASFHQGIACKTDREKMRPYTKRGLALHLGVPTSRLDSYAKRGDDWSDVMGMIDDIIWTQKFEGAAANLLNPGLIQRDLGLADKSELSGPGGRPIETQASIDVSKLSDEAMEELLHAAIDPSGSGGD